MTDFRWAIRASLAIGLSAGWMATATPSASADVQLGQVPSAAPDFANSPPTDWLQPQVTSQVHHFVSYVVPAGGGTITSWSTYGATFTCSPACAMTLKVYRPDGVGHYLVVAHDGPRTITANKLNTFTGLDIPVKAGDIVGLHNGGGDPRGDAPVFSTPDNSTQSYLVAAGDASDGTVEAFTGNSGQYVLNLAVNLAPPSGGGGKPPSNIFTIHTSQLTLNKKKGTATLPVTLPDAGKLVLSGKSIAGVSDTIAVAGTVKLTIKATGKAKAKLAHSGKVAITITITFTPTGGQANAKTIKIKLVKRKR